MDSTEEQQPVVRMRGRPLNETNGTNATNGTNGAQNALQRGLEALQENCSEETEEIRKLDSQLDHLNDYMSKMEERLKLHNEKLMETLRHQKEEREKRRRSFHERMTQNQAEDTAFQQQMASILNRVDSVRNRQSIFDIVNNMDIPKLEFHALIGILEYRAMSGSMGVKSSRKQVFANRNLSINKLF
ncbi:hypothetical protein ANCCEY_00436 [Ancylostoma ceylanicum]|uniref:Uncharacterized protein n=1 Tax=Ancylostoma ceylanicum TaxID=53326 RepID=A0A0D6M8Q3_9BILA|nr:hypothetical protein ANCCEY_00436 [Ancylostoma ceylanicum]